MSKISIITTTYKHQDFIAEAIESVLAQTYTDRELLIGDDSPDDKTRTIIEQYVKKYPNKIKAWRHNPRKGLIDNMNFLIEQINKNSQYIGFLEGDDSFAKENLMQKAYILDTNHDVGLVYSNYIESKDGANLHGIPGDHHGKSLYTLEKFLRKGPHIQSFGSAIIRKSIFFAYRPKKLPNGSSMFGPWDYFHRLCIVPNTVVFYIPVPLFIYRIHKGNFSKNIEIMYEQFNVIYNYAIKQTQDNNIHMIYKCFIHKNLGVISLLRHNTKFARKYLIESFRYDYKIDLLQRIALILSTILPHELFAILFKIFKK